MKVPYSSEVMMLVSDACGPEGCERLLSAYGGQRIRIPKNVAGRLLEPLGADVLHVLVRYYADTDLDVPSRGGAERLLKSAMLKRDVIHSAMSANELASKHGVTATYIHRLRRDLLTGREREVKKAKA